jgi:alpha-N-arabinofuranosidase
MKIRRLSGLMTSVMLLTSQVSQAGEIEAVLHADAPGPVVDRHIFGQFSEHIGTGIEGGLWVGTSSPIPNIRGFRLDVLKALQALKIPVLRWPGGCYADQYHWRDGIGPAAQRPVRINVNWGGVEEHNGFGTHEFLDLAELLGADAYLAANVGSAPPSETEDWLEYLTSPSHSTLADERRRNGRDRPWSVPYIGVGNESWGCGGSMTAEYYADLYRRYQSFVPDIAGQKHIKIASGPNADDLAWTETLMRKAGSTLQAISLHDYTLPTGDWKKKGPSTGFGLDDYAHVMAGAYDMDRIVKSHVEIMDRFDPERKVTLAVDEWGIWTDPLPGTNPAFLQQQNSLRDALYAAVVIDVFVANAERVKLANIAQTVNVLQAMVMTDGPHMLLTPTYHVFSLYRPFQDATRLPLDIASPDYVQGELSIPAVSAAAARGTDGAVHIALVNADPAAADTVSVRLEGMAPQTVHGDILTAAEVSSINEFGKPPAVAPASFTGARLDGGVLHVELPAKSLVVLELR